MSEVFVALARACRSLMHPRMFLLMIWPMLLSVTIWVVAGIFFGAHAWNWLFNYMNHSPVAEWTSQWFSFAPVAMGAAWIVIVILFFPLIMVTASLIVGIFGMPAMVDHVASRDYPALERKRGGSITAMTVNAFYALIVFLVLSLLSLPLWFVPLLWPVLPVLLFAYFNQRMFRFDALGEHASDEEMRRIFDEQGSSMFVLAILLSLLAHVPILGFFAPVLAGLAFIHFGLASLEILRRQP
jgi:CysZ protein